MNPALAPRSTQQRPEFMRLRQVLTWTGLGRSTIYRMVAAEKFPTPVRLGSRAVAWRTGDLEAWSDSRAPLRGES